MNNTDTNLPVTHDHTSGEVLPMGKKIDLAKIDDVRLEMAKVYRDMKGQKIPAQDGTRLVYVLTQIGKMIELHDIEKRINRIEEYL